LRCEHDHEDFLVSERLDSRGGIAIALGLTSLLTHQDVNALWLLPLVVAFLLAASLWRATRSRRI
jgi:hypothetical protein